MSVTEPSTIEAIFASGPVVDQSMSVQTMSVEDRFPWNARDGLRVTMPDPAVHHLPGDCTRMPMWSRRTTLSSPSLSPAEPSTRAMSSWSCPEASTRHGGPRVRDDHDPRSGTQLRHVDRRSCPGPADRASQPTCASCRSSGLPAPDRHVATAMPRMWRSSPSNAEETDTEKPWTASGVSRPR